MFHSPIECRACDVSPRVFPPGLRAVSLKQILAQPRDDSTCLVDQLQLAYRLVMGFLQFHSTPWITNSCNSEQLCFYSSGDRLSNQDLRTLHVTKDIMTQNTLVANSWNSDIEAKPLLYGIRNVVLWRLGVFLLSIAFWRDIDPTSIEEIRRLADPSRRRGGISPAFIRIAQRCIDCDFGFGSDLGKTSLQRAINEHVVDELQEMIAALDIKDD
jgi:hypothetical protein